MRMGVFILIGLFWMPPVSFAQEQPPIPYAATPDKPEEPNTQKMHSRKMSTGQSKKSTFEKSAEAKPDEEKPAEFSQEKSKDPEDDIWRKYKKISGKAKEEKIAGEVAKAQEGTDSQEPKRKSFKKRTEEENTETSENADTDEEETKETAEAAPKAGADIGSILDGYVQRTTKAPRMGTRSFKNPEDSAKKKEETTETEEQDKKEENSEP